MYTVPISAPAIFCAALIALVMARVASSMSRTTPRRTPWVRSTPIPSTLADGMPGIARGFGDGRRDLGCAKVDGSHELFLRFGHAALQRTTTWSANRPSSSA